MNEPIEEFFERLPSGHVRTAGLRLRCEGTRRPPRATGLERPGVRRSPRERGGGSQAAVQPRLLGRGGRVLRARARLRGAPGRRARVEQRPSPVERHRRQVQGKGRRRQSPGPEALLRLGRSDAGRGGRPVQPHRLPRRHRVALRQLVHRLGAPHVRLQGRGGDDRRGDPRRGRVLRRTPARGVRWLRALAHEVPGPIPHRLQPPGMVDGGSAPAPSHHARAGTGRGAPGRGPALPRSIGRLELLDIPGRWGRMDAFGRGRVDVEQRRTRGRQRGTSSRQSAAADRA